MAYFDFLLICCFFSNFLESYSGPQNFSYYKDVYRKWCYNPSFSELRKAKDDVNAMKTQAENVSKEYDRLVEDHSKLEKKLRIAGGGEDDGDKKND